MKIFNFHVMWHSTLVAKLESQDKSSFLAGRAAVEQENSKPVVLKKRKSTKHIDCSESELKP